MKNISLIFIMLISLISCNKDSVIGETVNDNIKSIEKAFIPDILYHYQKFTQKTSGYLSIQSYRTLAVKDNPLSGSYKVGGLILNNEGNASDFGTMTIGNKILEANTGYNNMYGLRSNEGSDLYGNNVKFSINTYLPITEMYVPKVINITSHDHNDSPIISINDAIEWNMDNNNELGVIMVVSYYLEDNIELSNQYSEEIHHAILTEDDGVYSFTNNDLSKFPLGVKLRIKLVRGNYKIQEASDGRDLTLWAYSMMEGIFNYE